jgi:hypothetical protein
LIQINMISALIPYAIPIGARERAMPIRPYLEGDPETTSLMAIAFEIVRAAVRAAPRPDLTDEMIAETIIKLAKNGERNVNVLCEAALSPPILFRPAPSPPTCPPSAMTIQQRDSERGHRLASNPRSVSRLPPPTLRERRHGSLAS